MLTHLLDGGETFTYDYDIPYGCIADRVDTTYMQRTPPSTDNNNIWTCSCWIKMTDYSAHSIYGADKVGGDERLDWHTNTSGQLVLYATDGTPTVITNITFDASLRDLSAWYHIVLQVDTAQATEADRVTVWVNGVEVSPVAGGTWPTQNLNIYGNHAAPSMVHYLMSDVSGAYLNGVMAEYYHIDGTAYTASDFGELKNGIWIPKTFAGSYGTNGCYCDFADSSDLGDDESGNGRDWTEYNYTTANQVEDTPTHSYCNLGEGFTPSQYSSYVSIADNYQAGGTTVNLTDGTLESYDHASWLIPDTGKWYFEAEVIATVATTNICQYVGFIRAETDDVSASWYAYEAAGNYWNGSAWAAYGATYTGGDIIGIAIDMATGIVTFYKNNATQGTAYTLGDLAGERLIVELKSGTATGGAACGWICDFGQLGFTYTPPTGYSALVTTNISNFTESAVLEGNKTMDVIEYTGTGGAQSLTYDQDFNPNLVWIKSQDEGAVNYTGSNVIADTIQTAGKYWRSDTNAGQVTDAQSVTAFNSDGFSVGTADVCNYSGDTFTAWAWRESPTNGIHILTFEGTGSAHTEAHGLGAVPELMIVKNMDATGVGCVYTSLTGATKYVNLDTTAVATTSSTVWNDTAPTSTVFSVGTSAATNGSGNTIMAYLFKSIAGFSAIGAYMGNGVADGPYIHTGFKPRYVLIRGSDVVGHWLIIDTERDLFNSATELAYMEDSLADVSDTFPGSIMINANGFKVTSTYASTNTDTKEYFYMAFGQVPFKFSTAR